MAAALHDDALQTLLAAHDDLLEGLQGDRERVQRAYSSISLAMSSLRSLLARLGPADVDAPLMGDVLAAAARRARERSGLAVEVYCRPELLDLRDAEAAATIRELVLNVERHAMASRMRISVSGTEAGVLVEVADDGCGCVEPTLADLVDNGHLGLALIARRARERSGWFRLQPAPGGGTLARALLPCRSSSCDRRCQAPPDEATAF
jgi:signal transduction histidine kinase